MPRFTLELELGNDAMQAGDDVGRALGQVAMLLEGLKPEELLELVGGSLPGIRDLNGNTCGRWAVEA